MKNKKVLSLILPIAILLLLIGATWILSNQLKTDQSLEDTSAFSSSSSLAFKAIPPKSKLPGNMLSVSIYIDFIAPNNLAHSAFIVMNFNNKVLNITKILPGKYIIVSQKEINNNNGTVKLQLATSTGSPFVTGQNLITI